MNAWSNIEISPRDTEITIIDNLEKSLGDLPQSIHNIRQLITRFEVCHFKYKAHLKKIRDSIASLEPDVDTAKIGINHIQHGEHTWYKDKTGKSLPGQQYVWALKAWLNENGIFSGRYDRKLGQRIHKWLGEKNPDKDRLVRLLLARLTWDWESYEKYQYGGKFKDIEFQACRMDICHYAFPENLNVLLQGMGQMKAVDEKTFEGCGSYTAEIKAYLEKEFLNLNETLRTIHAKNALPANDLIRIWLTACLAKTIKENVNCAIPIAGIEDLN
jgi:hypothetical protein